MAGDFPRILQHFYPLKIEHLIGSDIPGESLDDRRNHQRDSLPEYSQIFLLLNLEDSNPRYRRNICSKSFMSNIFQTRSILCLETNLGVGELSDNSARPILWTFYPKKHCSSSRGDSLFIFQGTTLSNFSIPNRQPKVNSFNHSKNMLSPPSISKYLSKKYIQILETIFETALNFWVLILSQL